MTERHATTNDLPGWNTAATVLDLTQHPGTHGWVWLQNPGRPMERLQPIGRDLAGHLYAASRTDFVGRVSKPAVEQGYLALLVGVEDGIGLWLPRTAYHHIGLIDPNQPSEQPDVPRWIPIREVLGEMPDDVAANLHA